MYLQPICCLDNENTIGIYENTDIIYFLRFVSATISLNDYNILKKLKFFMTDSQGSARWKLVDSIFFFSCKTKNILNRWLWSTRKRKMLNLVKPETDIESSIVVRCRKQILSVKYRNRGPVKYRGVIEFCFVFFFLICHYFLTNNMTNDIAVADESFE